jgi:excisionase family DNA binding protein
MSRYADITITDNQPLRGYKPSQVAELLGLQRETVLGWIRSGKIRAINLNPDATHPLGFRYRILNKDLEDFLEARRVKR